MDIQTLTSQASNTAAWIFLAAVIVAVLLINRLVHWLLAARLRRIRPEKQIWRYAVLSALNAPARILFWLIAIVLIKYRLLPTGTAPWADRIFLPATSVAVIL